MTCLSGTMRILLVVLRHWILGGSDLQEDRQTHLTLRTESRRLLNQTRYKPSLYFFWKDTASVFTYIDAITKFDLCYRMVMMKWYADCLLISNVTRHSRGWQYTVISSFGQTLHQYLTLLLNCTLLPNLTFYPIARPNKEDVYSSGHLVLSRFGLACFLWYQSLWLSWYSLRIFDFRTFPGTSILPLIDINR